MKLVPLVITLVIFGSSVWHSADATMKWIPVLRFDCTNMQATCENICYAIQTVGKPDRLTRTSGGAETRYNRNRSCQNLVATTTCTADEYPFASTQENPPNPVCTLVPIAEEAEQTSQMNALYKHSSANGVIDFNQEFKVKLSNYVAQANPCFAFPIGSGRPCVWNGD
ncbi:uncharacterized protein LOC114531003 [Dendronephthya gigantea]|uniref:uncharacterized protein LOC114531003 n=1 Tax=Dendronephthya gigantea TaxID=151771 RepID=UPI001069E798|nr:uncharacterized protein LOC114531003 [Dendronephthya gigantea]